MNIFKFEQQEPSSEDRELLGSRFATLVRSKDSLRYIYWHNHKVDFVRPLPPVEVPKQPEPEITPQPEIADNLIDMASKIVPGALSDSDQLSKLAREIAKPAYDISEAA